MPQEKLMMKESQEFKVKKIGKSVKGHKDKIPRLHCPVKMGTKTIAWYKDIPIRERVKKTFLIKSNLEFPNQTTN